MLACSGALGSAMKLEDSRRVLDREKAHCDLSRSPLTTGDRKVSPLFYAQNLQTFSQPFATVTVPNCFRDMHGGA